MLVTTSSENKYTYLRSTNEIVEGDYREEITPITFIPREEVTGFNTLQAFTLGITTKCNMRCSYCCYSGAYENHRRHGNSSMTSNDIDDILRFISAHVKQFPFVISFYGGECLLNLDTIDYCIAKAKSIWHDLVDFEISTNGLLLSEELIDRLCRQNITILLSLDGPGHFQDRQRIAIEGEGSFDKVKKSIGYILHQYPEYSKSKLLLLMTLTRTEDLPEIATLWHQDEVLQHVAPARISAVAPNYGNGVQQCNFEEELKKYLNILEQYELHRDYQVLKVFFARFLAEWIERPIFKINQPQKVPTCIPNNRKLYIDTFGDICVCEKIPDIFRFGTVKEGIDWQKVNSMTNDTHNLIVSRCASCVVARLCEVCPSFLDLSLDQLDIHCYNQRVIQRVKLHIFCEMAERNLL